MRTKNKKNININSDDFVWILAMVIVTIMAISACAMLSYVVWKVANCEETNETTVYVVKAEIVDKGIQTVHRVPPFSAIYNYFIVIEYTDPWYGTREQSQIWVTKDEYYKYYNIGDTYYHEIVDFGGC